MTNIHNSDIQKRIIDEAKLQVAIDKVPQQLAEKVVPVLISNPKGKKRLLIFTDNNARNIFNNGLYVPAGKKWKILQAFIRLTTNGTVSDRNVNLELTSHDASIPVYKVAADSVQPASLTEYYNFVTGQPTEESPSGTHYIALAKDLFLLEGFSIWFAVDNVQAGDNVRFYCLIEEADLLVSNPPIYTVVP